MNDEQYSWVNAFSVVFDRIKAALQDEYLSEKYPRQFEVLQRREKLHKFAGPNEKFVRRVLENSGRLDNLEDFVLREIFSRFPLKTLGWTKFSIAGALIDGASTNDGVYLAVHLPESDDDTAHLDWISPLEGFYLEGDDTKYLYDSSSVGPGDVVIASRRINNYSNDPFIPTSLLILFPINVVNVPPFPSILRARLKHLDEEVAKESEDLITYGLEHYWFSL